RAGRGAKSTPRSDLWPVDVLDVAVAPVRAAPPSAGDSPAALKLKPPGLAAVLAPKLEAGLVHELDPDSFEPRGTESGRHSGLLILTCLLRELEGTVVDLLLEVAVS